jgi:hypothetical protein
LSAIVRQPRPRPSASALSKVESNEIAVARGWQAIRRFDQCPRQHRGWEMPDLERNARSSQQ